MAFLRMYQRGDPGFFSFLKKGAKKLGGLIKKAAPIAVGFVPGVGGIAARALYSSGGQGGPTYPAPSPVLSGGLSGMNTLGGKLGPLARRYGPALGRAALSRLGQNVASRFLPASGVAPDFGNVSTGSSSTSPFLGGRRYRRMNVTNVRALRRSIRRVKGFAKIARQCLVYERKVRCRKRGR